jgi:hypothetical protein
MKNGRDPPQIRVDIGKRKKRKKENFHEGPVGWHERC